MSNTNDWPGTEYLKYLVLKDSLLSSESRQAICKICQELGMGRTTLYSRLRDPGSWKLREIKTLAKYLHMSAEDVVTLLLYGDPRGIPNEK